MKRIKMPQEYHTAIHDYKKENWSSPTVDDLVAYCSENAWLTLLSQCRNENHAYNELSQTIRYS